MDDTETPESFLGSFVGIVATAFTEKATETGTSTTSWGQDKSNVCSES